MINGGNICNILICGYHKDCGFDITKFIILDIVNSNKFRCFTINEINIDTSDNFFDVYGSLRYYDYVILCRRNVLDITTDSYTIGKYLEQYNCWTLFASVVLGYEESVETLYNKLNRLFNKLDPVPEDRNLIENTKLLNFLRSNDYL